MTAWTPEELDALRTARELQIAVRRSDDTLRRPVTVWVVTTDDADVIVRTWYRRDTGWFGGVLVSGRARIEVPGVAADVVVHDVGAAEPALRAAADAAYRTKYGRGGGAERMVSAEAAATTLRLVREGTGQT